MPVYQLPENIIFPPPSEAEVDGLLAVGGDLSANRLLLAYASGIFPWFSKDDPILWWSPDPRLILLPNKFKVSKSLKQTIRNKNFEVRFDTCFEQVIENCSTVKRHDQDGTWITNKMKTAYINLHNHGFAHSVETFLNNELIGGLYGISLGGCFCGESMFQKVSDASKVAMYYLIEKIKAWNFDFIDAQTHTPHLESLGAELIAREKFLDMLNNTLEKKTHKGTWNQN